MRLTFETTMHGNTTGNLTVDFTRKRWNVGSGVTDGEATHESITTGESSKADNEGSEIVLDVEALHDTAVNLLNGTRPVARDVAMVSKGVQSRAGAAEIIRPRGDVWVVVI